VLVEQLAQRGLLKVICGTDYARRRDQCADPHRALHAALQVQRREDRHPQRSRLSSDQRTCGRKGFDDVGWVVAQAPAHAIENLLLEQKQKKFVKRKPPERNFRELGQSHVCPLNDGTARAAD
jgi:hypothetical protein